MCLTGTSKLQQIFNNFKIHFPSIYLFGCLIHLHVTICFLYLCGFSQQKWSLALNLWQISYYSLLNEASKEWQWSVSFAQIHFQEAYQNFCVSCCAGKEGIWQIRSNFVFTFSLSSISQEQASESCASSGKYSENSEGLQIFIRISKKSAIIIYSNGQASLSPPIARVEHRAGLMESHKGYHITRVPYQQHKLALKCRRYLIFSIKHTFTGFHTCDSHARWIR